MMPYITEISSGIMIGIASALPLLYEGRIAGVSGYAASSLRPTNTENKTALFFVLGLIVSGFLWKLLEGQAPNITSNTPKSLLTWGAAGLLVGFGSRLGGGCTSGHGVCGLGRASPRSLVSVAIFISAAILTTVLMRLYL